MATNINCPPFAPVLMESTRAIGYSTESAIADIIDNSISAHAHNIHIFFDTIFPAHIAISDDGWGMDEDELTLGMRYGGNCLPSEERGKDDLGRYGLGMKTASLSQCRCMTVISKKNGHINARQWNLDHIIDSKDWNLLSLSHNEINELKHIDFFDDLNSGTIVLWTELDRIKEGSLGIEKSLESRMNDTKKHLELVFHRYLSGDGVNPVNVYINGIKLVPFDPFFESKSDRECDDEFIEIPGRKGKVSIRPYTLPHPSRLTKSELDRYGGKEGLRNLQGFYIYRNKRLLTWGTWFKLRKMDEFSKLSRIRVDIPNSLDDLWTLDIKKSTAYPPEIVKTRLKQLVEVYSLGSRRTWNFRRRKENNTNIVNVWEKTETRDGVKYIINKDHPVLKLLSEKIDSESRELLMHYLETVQNNLLLNNLHYDLNSDVKILHDSESAECIRVKSMAKMLVNSFEKKGFSQADAIEEIIKTEPFSSYITEIKETFK